MYVPLVNFKNLLYESFWESTDSRRTAQTGLGIKVALDLYASFVTIKILLLLPCRTE